MEQKIKTQNGFLTARQHARSIWSNIEHRMETVAEINGVEYINDSKATDVDATFYTLELLEKPLVWIVGTSDYEEDYAVFQKLVKYKVIKLVCFGENDSAVSNSLEKWVDKYHHTTNLEDAFAWASTEAEKGSAVLLSPASPSFDLFKNFRERGEQFRSLVSRLK